MMNTERKPLILVTNDDGVTAPGIRVLIDLMRQLGEVVVVAPDTGMSGQGHAITIKTPLTFKEIQIEQDYKEYSCNGTPADCVKLALHRLLDRKPDLVVSGINHGANSSVNIIYSGTMAAVLEACMGGIPAIGYSNHEYNTHADLSPAKDAILKIASETLQNGLPKGVGLNVNFPVYKDGEPYKGIKVCRQGNGYWKEDFAERADPRTGKPYFWLTGSFHKYEVDQQDTDLWAIENYMVSVVPVQYDFTAHQTLNEVSAWNL
jgi:5'-nucleotidase